MAESFKFQAALLQWTAIETLFERISDRPGAQSVAREVGGAAADDPLKS